MIVYNFRANGPYEYDKFMLNYGQLFNMAQDTKNAWNQCDVHEQDRILSQHIQQITEEDNLLAHIMTVKHIVME